MKKKIVLSIVMAILLLLAGVSVWLLTHVSKYQIVVGETERVLVTDEGLQVEAGETVTIPQAEVYDRSGNYCEDFVVTREITDENGNKKAGTLQMEHGQIYTVTYMADNGSEQLEETMKLYCYDTVLPTVSLLKMQKSYNVKDEIVIQIQEASKDIDYDKSSIKLVNKTEDKEQKLEFKEAYKFVAEKESEQYAVVCNLKDVNGNENVQEFEFIIAGEFQDDNIDKNNIWDFDELGYLNNIKLAGASDDLKYDIVTKKLPKDKKKIGVDGGALKLTLKGGETYDFTLIDGNAFQIIDSSAIGFRIWADEVVDIFEIYNVEDNTMVDLSWKVHKRNAWQTVEFDPEKAFTEDYMFDSVRIVLSCERDVTVYIDSVYYKDYIEPWRDEDLPSGVLAVFDDPRYLERVSETSNVDSATFGASWEQVSKISGTTDFTGGALKIASTTDPTIGYDKNARDGFKFQLFDRLKADDIGGLVIRVYCEDPHTALAVNFVDKKMGESRFVWPSLEGTAGNWVNVIISKEDIAGIIDGYENITHLNIRFIRPASSIVPGKEEYVSYIDKISLYELDYKKVKYTFADDYDMRVVSSVGNGTGVRVADKSAKDGYALKGKTVYSHELSGVEVSFNNLDLSLYSSIYVTLRGTDSIELWLNGKYANYANYSEYTEVDILPYLLQAGEKTLKTMTVGRKSVAGVDIYIDGISFITKENAPVYNDFTLNLNDFGNNVGSTKYNNFEGGTLANIVSNSIKKGSYQGKTDVLSFTTKEDKDGKYSGGGLYVDFSNKLPNGKIQSTVDFTVNAQVYSDRTAAVRVGIIFGNNAAKISWKNVWVDLSTEMTGWQTISITSKQIRALEDCADKEITGIYFGVHTANCSFGIKEVNVDFGTTNQYPIYKADSSYLTKRDDNSVYLSNFDDAYVLNNADEVGLNPWNKLVEEKGTTSHGTLTNGNGSYKGIKLAINDKNSYSGFKYHLPVAFNLENAHELVFRIASEDWTSGYVPSFIYLTEGAKKVNVIEYCKIYVGTDAKGTSVSKTECLDGVNYQTVCVAVDVATLMKKTGMASIDGFIYGHSNSGLTQVVDEWYYTLGAVDDGGNEDEEPEYGELTTTKFNSQNTVGGNYTMTDTDNGLQITGSAWTNAVYTFDKPLNGADIETITVRFKVTGGESAIMYFYSNGEHFYVELNNVPAEQVVNRVIDSEGFTVLTLNFQTFSMDAGDTWSLDTRSTKPLTSIGLCCNNATGAPTFDYIAYNVEMDDEGDVNGYLDFIVDVEKGREIRILQLTDTQIIDPGQKRYPSRIGSSSSITTSMMYETCFSYIEDAINKTKPDLILLTGDIVYGEFDDDGHIFQAIVEYMDSFGIPWAPVYGNHDNESQMGVTWQNEQLINAENCLFKKGDVTGNGNYTIGITQGGELVKVIYMMDSNGCARAYTHTYEEDGETKTLNYNENESVKTTIGFAEDQREWLSNTASAITTLTDGKVSSMIAFHIPIAQFSYGVYEAGYQSDASLSNSELYEIGKDVTAQEGDSGYKGATFKDIYEDAKLWEILKANNFDGVFCGHSHENSVSVKYDGIRLTFGLKTGIQERYVDGHTGGTLISMQSDGSFTVTHQYYKLDLSEVDYSFSGTNDKDMKSVGVYGNANVLIVEDSTATDGYALEVQRFGHGGGVKLVFDSINISEYDKLILRMRKGQNNLFIYANDIYLGACTSTTYEEIDLLSLLIQNGISTLDKLVIKNDNADTMSFYIDSITLHKKDNGNNESDQYETTYLTAANTVGGYYEKTDTDNGLQITGAAWKYEMHTLQTPINGSDIKTVTVRFKVTGGESAIMKFYSGDEFFYVALNGATGEYVVNKTTDDAGFTILTMDFSKISMDAGDTWTPDERATKELTAIGLCCNNATGAPTFDYVAYNVDVSNEEDSGQEIEEISYTFADENDLTIATEKNSSWVKGIVAEDGANDGYSLLCSTAPVNDSGVKLTFDNIDVSEYEHIYLRIRTTDYVCIRFNDEATEKVYAKYDEYTTVDLAEYAAQGTILNSISIDRNMVSLDIYIDEIMFVPKTQTTNVFALIMNFFRELVA